MAEEESGKPEGNGRLSASSSGTYSLGRIASKTKPEGSGRLSASSSGTYSLGRIASKSKLVIGKVNSGNWERDTDLDAERRDHHANKGWKTTLLLAYQALGVVYGDIGTSPLYTVDSILKYSEPSKDNLLGVLSLIIWGFITIVLIKYCWIVLLADDHGNGGTFALYSLLKRTGNFRTFGSEATDQDKTLPGYGSTGPKFPSSHDLRESWRHKFLKNRYFQRGLQVFVMLGVGLLMGDGVLTPAISVLSACEGIQGRIEGFSKMSGVYLALAILATLFLVQRFGTAYMGAAFSPIVILWLSGNAIIGIYNISKSGVDVFRAFSPHYIYIFFRNNKTQGWRKLGSVLLAFTGVEALYADLGHFNREAVALSCVYLALPCLVITYLGQGACLMEHPDRLGRTYWACTPDSIYWLMLVLATLATVVASQALISAVFQLVYQAIGHDFFPRVKIIHTSSKVQGQVYVPLVNYILMGLTLLAVGVFQTSSKLGQAYGLAVVAIVFMTTQLMVLVMVCVWDLPLWLTFIFWFFYSLLEGAILSATLEKVEQGGWFPLTMAAIYAVVMLLWFWGKTQKKLYFKSREARLETVLSSGQGPGDILVLAADKQEIYRCPGIGVYYSESIYGVPPVVLEQLKALHTLHQVCIFVTNRRIPLPTVRDRSRLLVNQLEEKGIYHAVARYGYMDTIEQGYGFVTSLLNHLRLLLLRALYNCLGTSDGLKALLLTPELTTKLYTDPGIHIIVPKDVNGADEYVTLAGMDEGDDNIDVAPPMHDTWRHSVTGGSQAIELKAGTLSPTQLQALSEIAEELHRNPPAPAQPVAKLSQALRLASELHLISNAKDDVEKQTTYVFGRTFLRPSKSSLAPQTRLHRLLTFLRLNILERPYDLLERNFTEDAVTLFNVPKQNLMELAMGYELPRKQLVD